MSKQHHFVITRHMVLRELEKLDTSKAPGPDNVSNKILKGAREDLCNIITDLLNISVSNSFVPYQWKQATIIPIPKTQNPQATCDYRPIALTSSLCKVTGGAYILSSFSFQK